MKTDTHLHINDGIFAMSKGLFDNKIYELTDKLIEHSFLSKELKKQYRLVYKSRVESYLNAIE